MIKNIKKAIVFIVAAGYFVAGNLSFLAAKEIILGGKNGWSDFQEAENITTGKGRYGYECIELASNSFVFDSATDLLIDFENPENPVSSGNYTVRKNNLQLSNQTRMDKRAGLSRNTGGMSIFGEPGTFFGTEGLMGSFSIEFWLCPSIAENGEIVMNWETSKEVNHKLIYQHIDAVFNKGHLEWNLSNFFDAFFRNNTQTEITMKGTSKIIPDTWSYHALSYDCENGRLEYLVNGITEDIKYMTSTGLEDGETSFVVLGAPSEVSFCPDYTGKIDEIRILRRPYSPPDFQSAENAGKVGHTQYIPQGGRFVTQPIIVSNGSVLNSMTAEMDVPAQTEVCFYVRSGDNFFGWSDSYPEWKPVESGEILSDVKGLYFQVAAELLPDGAGETSPTITQLVLDFSELPEPIPPFVVKAKAGNGSVKVSWSYSVDDTTGGYYLYYGNRPGEYLGRIAVEGASPINVGSVTSFTVTGLENGKIYYFAVAAWSKYDERVVGNLSKEVFARPLARLK